MSNSGGDARTRGASASRSAVTDRRTPGRYIREVIAELGKVIWPGRKELITYTVVVIIFMSVMVAIVSGLDILFAQGVLAVFG